MIKLKKKKKKIRKVNYNKQIKYPKILNNIFFFFIQNIYQPFTYISSNLFFSNYSSDYAKAHVGTYSSKHRMYILPTMCVGLWKEIKEEKKNEWMNLGMRCDEMRWDEVK